MMPRFRLLAAISALSLVCSMRGASAQMMAHPIAPSGSGMGAVGSIGTQLGGSGLGAGGTPSVSLSPPNLTGSLPSYTTPTVTTQQPVGTGTSTHGNDHHQETSTTPVSTVPSSSMWMDPAAEAHAAVARGVALHPTGGSPPKDKDKDDDDKQGNNWWLWLLLVAVVIVISSWKRRSH